MNEHEGEDLFVSNILGTRKTDDVVLEKALSSSREHLKLMVA